MGALFPCISFAPKPAPPGRSGLAPDHLHRPGCCHLELVERPVSGGIGQQSLGSADDPPESFLVRASSWSKSRNRLEAELGSIGAIARVRPREGALRILVTRSAGSFTSTSPSWWPFAAAVSVESEGASGLIQISESSEGARLSALMIRTLW